MANRALARREVDVEATVFRAGAVTEQIPVYPPNAVSLAQTWRRRTEGHLLHHDGVGFMCRPRRGPDQGKGNGQHGGAMERRRMFLIFISAGPRVVGHASDVRRTA